MKPDIESIGPCYFVIYWQGKIFTTEMNIPEGDWSLYWHDKCVGSGWCEIEGVVQHLVDTRGEIRRGP